MDPLSGKPLTLLAALLAAASLAVALSVAASGDFRPPRDEAVAGGAADPERARGEVASARSAESAGDVAGALSHYRAAAEIDPRVVDARSPAFLGRSFEAGLKRWIWGLKRGEIAGGGRAMEDAAFLFRRMYGGCG